MSLQSGLITLGHIKRTPCIISKIHWSSIYSFISTYRLGFTGEMKLASRPRVKVRLDKESEVDMVCSRPASPGSQFPLTGSSSLPTEA